MALSVDHKPNRPDERERVMAAGGHVIFAGCWRVPAWGYAYGFGQGLG